MLATYTKLEWLVNHILLFSQSAHATHVTYVYRLPPSVGLILACPNYTACVTTVWEKSLLDIFM